MLNLGQYNPSMNFENGRFVLNQVLLPSPHPRWQHIDDRQYETVDLKAAADYRKFATPETERLLKRLFQEHYPLPEIPPLPMLDTHQRVGLEWILERKRSYIAHAPGAGKTAQAILAALIAPGFGQTLFIVPPNLIMNWEREIAQVATWAGVHARSATVPRTEGRHDMDWDSDILLVPDSMIAKDWVQRAIVPRAHHKEIQFIAVDEASRLKEPWSERSLAFYGGSFEGKVFPGIYRDARHVVFLDGSPMPNRPIELWAPTYALHPEAIDCMDRDDFGYRYCGARPNERGVWEYNYSSHESELQEKLQRDFMHVVTEEKLTHPERLRSLLFTDTDLRSPDHKAWDRKNLGEIDFDEIDEESSQGDLARFRRELGVSKIPFVTAYTESRLKGKNESILLFAWHREVCQRLAENLSKWNPGLVMGGTSAKERDAAFSAFQLGTVKLLVLNISAGGRGHNLQRADRAIFAEYSWSDEMNRQCEKRGSRRGSTVDVFRSDYIACPDSLDEPMLGSLFTKQKRFRRIIG